MARASTTLPRRTRQLLDELRDSVREDCNAFEQQLACDEFYRAVIHDRELPASEQDEFADKRLKVRLALQRADIACRAQTGQPLRTIKHYLRYRQDGDPGTRMIYNAFGSWGYAVLSARDAEHVHDDNRRQRGGNRRTGEFDAASCERALLRYAENHGGVLPEHGEWLRYVTFRPEEPSYSQVVERGFTESKRTWTQAKAAAHQRALDEDGWPLTRLRVQLAQAGAR